jgi:curved DNA-binding protein
MEFKDYYKVLGVEKTTSDKEIKSAYRKLARKFHPDVNKDKGAQDRFKEINEAYAVLSDSEKRRKYDELGSNWDQYERFNPGPNAGRRTVYSWGGSGNPSQEAGQGFDFSDFFQIFFGGATQGGQAGAGNPFENVFSQFSGQRVQPERPRKAPEQEADFEVDIREVASGAERQVSIGGRTLDVRIPKGIREGMKLRIGAEKSGAGADILLKVRYRKDPRFSITGEDVESTADVPVTVAALGGEIQVDTLYGHMTVKVPPGTQGGRTLRLRGQGLPRWKSEEKGDHHVRLNLVIPADLTAEEKELFKKLADSRAGK